ncbi:chromosomal replication initiator protein DnaA [Pseudoclavibacter endophyticus]|uniref:Chromosomal replication initiator protein DnaA n=2 Tax=Pseudoclavibacter endophyticus TaxID=1778590 RepID=A0A6H9WHK0_9MICO|nr:chromosomal replication initiator protein DnaA [Pseudoclavibacter endophyticus]KAB1648773.1 chromosomal replication initiator protein DnaA [Pseudoclavibacter endophyticus]GGA68624.1 chromosomal replication initiator protein DnaA [Pseudoclavibacter endophyticus]
MPESVETVWAGVLSKLDDDTRITPTLQGFLRIAVPKGVMAGTIYLEVQNDLTRSMIEQRARVPLTEALAALENDDVTSFAVTVNPDAEHPRAAESTVRPAREERAGYAKTTRFDADAPDFGGDVAPRTPGDHSQATVPRAAHGQHVAPPAGPDHHPRSTPGPDHAPRSPLDGTSRPVSAFASPSDADARAVDGESRLNPKYTFDNFVIGGSNRFAHAAAFAVAEAPARAYNPLFIYGDSGLGKTHLLHAIGHYAQTMYPGIRVRYVSSEEFTNDFINAIANNMAQAFHARYRSIDILLIDDIQFLQGKDTTQETFFHTFNTLHEANKQVVITSDVPPKRLTGFEDRMRSRFEWGLITDVQSPDLETRIAILRKRAQAEDLTMPDDALEFIASRITTSIRELEGALIRVTAYANLYRQPIDLALVSSVLRDLSADDEPTVVAPVDIIRHTADYFRLTEDDLYGSSRSQAIATSRQIAMYLCREMTNLSLPKIGQLFGGRDHTTVMYAHRKITKLITERRDVYNQVTELTTRVRQNGNGSHA